MADHVFRLSVCVHEKSQPDSKVSLFPRLSFYSSLCCLPIQLESKYYPPAILLIFSLMMGPRIAMILGLLMGYVESFGYLDRVLPALNTILLWEQKNSIKPMTHWKGKLKRACNFSFRICQGQWLG